MSEYIRPEVENVNRPEIDLSNPRYPLVLMDFHGTIADRQLWSLRGLHETWRYHFGHTAKQEAFYNAMHRGNMTYSEYFQVLVDQDERISEVAREQARGELSRTYNRLMKDIFIPMPGMRRVLRSMLDAGIDIAVLTNGPETEKITRSLNQWKLPELAENFYNGPILQAKKPSAEALYRAIDSMSQRTGRAYEPGHVLMVGDHFDDTAGAMNSGVDSALIIRPIKQKIVELESPHPSYVIDDPRELLSIVAGQVVPLPSEDQNVVVYPPFFNSYAQPTQY